MTFPRIKLALVLFLLGLIGAVAVVPYAFTTVGVAQMQLSVPVENLMTLQVLLTVVLLFVAIPFGMAASGRVGIGAPYVARIVGAAVPALYVRTSSDGSRRAPGFGSFLLSVVLASAVGVIAAGLVVATDVLLFHTAIGAALARGLIASPFERLLAVLYGGINEELLMRFFGLSVIAWLFHRAERRSVPGLSRFGATMAVLIAAALFSIGHLPFASEVTILDISSTARSLLLNSMSGVLFGWLYWRRGLEAAMVAHGMADLILLVGLPWAVEQMTPVLL